MNAIAEKKPTNPLSYHEIDAESFHPWGDRVLLAWEDAPSELKFGAIKLIKPETERGRHYTGVVISISHDCSDEFKRDVHVGDRVIFEQFSSFEKFFDPEKGRLALIREGAALAIIPKRAQVEGFEEDFNYDL